MYRSHVMVCGGTGCTSSGSDKIAEAFENQIRTDGLDQEVRVDLIEDLSPGDYVIVHAGFAIQKMTQKEALENLKLLEEIKDAL